MSALRLATVALALAFCVPAWSSGPTEAADPHAAADHSTPAAGEHGAAEPDHGAASHASAAGDHGEGDHGAAAGHGDEGDHGGEHHAATPNWPAIGWHFFNVSLLFGVIIYVVRTPLMDEVRGRAVEIRKRLTEAARARDEARQRHDELATRLARFEDELKAMKQAAAVDAKQEEQKLIERARAEAERLRETAERSIRDEVVRAQVALRGEAVGLAVKLAEQTLKTQVQADDQKKFAAQFLDTVKSDEVSHG